MDAEARVRHVASTRTEPRNAGWIADEANVSRDTAVKYLERMVEQGDLEAVETDRGIGYKPDEVTQFLDEVRRLAEAHGVDELTAELDAIATEIEEWREAYDVESLSELRRSVGRDDLTETERNDRLETIAEWEYDMEIREAIRLAISLQDSLTTLEPFGDDSTDAVVERG
ncbi:hypothetical protein B4589_012565 [Halolamina sp. CBA1230]|nr:hypothetical protein B4589_012565 [Halolamina sp. CBA1230]